MPISKASWKSTTVKGWSNLGVLSLQQRRLGNFLSTLKKACRKICIAEIYDRRIDCMMSDDDRYCHERKN